MYLVAYMFSHIRDLAKKKGKIKMTGSNARIIRTEEKNITMTVRSKKNALIPQKIAGAVMLIFIIVSMFVGGGATGAVILSPMALAAVLSKHKLMDFGIFERRN